MAASIDEEIPLAEIIIPKSQRVSRELIPDDHEKPLNFEAIFGNANPVELEIGIGKGYFIQNEATNNPEHNFLGIEIRRKYLRKALERIEKRPLPNVRLITGEAFTFMEECLSAESLTVIHLYFPDPWPKKRHHKRRLFSPDFLKLVHKTLVPGGKLLVATDHKDYWEHITEVLDGQDFLEQCDAVPQTPEGAKGLTNYEIKYIEEGRPIYRLGYRKS